MASKRRLAPFRGDKALWIIIVLLYIISILVVYSSTGSMAYRKAGGDTSHYLMRQLMFVILGFLATVVTHLLSVKFLLGWVRRIFGISVILVILAYIIGVTYNDASRWIEIPGIGVTFAPSDMLRLSLAMLLAIRLGSRQSVIGRESLLPSLSYFEWKSSPIRNRNIWNYTTKPILLPIAIAVAVVLPSNLSTAVMIAAASFLILWVGRVNIRQLLRIMVISIIALVVVVSIMKFWGLGRAETWVNRIETFVTSMVGGDSDSKEVGVEASEADFQKEQARIAIASGGVIGKGPGNSTQRSQLPHPYSDFAYAFIVEEYGIFGGIIVLFLYLWMLYRAGVIIRRTRSNTRALVVFGVIITIVMQAFFNICVSVGIFPVTGQTLPLISLGGSSLVLTSVALGVVLSISRESDEHILQERRERKSANIEG